MTEAVKITIENGVADGRHIYVNPEFLAEMGALETSSHEDTDLCRTLGAAMMGHRTSAQTRPVIRHKPGGM